MRHLLPLTFVLLLGIGTTTDAQIFRFMRGQTVCRDCQPAPTVSVDIEPAPVSTGERPQLDVDSLVNRIVEILAADPRFARAPPIDYDYIRQMIVDAMPVTTSTVHFAVIADQRSDYWRRLSGIVEDAKEKYHGIILAPPPPRNSLSIGPLPQVVEYRNSIPQRTFFNREVYDVLGRIAKGTYPPQN